MERAWKARNRDERFVGSNPTRSASFSLGPPNLFGEQAWTQMCVLNPTPLESQIRAHVIESILAHVRDDRRIFLPPFDSEISRPSDQFALQSVGLEPNEFGGTVGEFRYQFEGRLML